LTLKQKTVDGLKWSFIDNSASLGLSFIFGIILARLLSPQEFGLIGMITIFIAIAGTFVNSGFGAALVRKQDCTQADYSTVFYFNLIIGLLFYLLLFFTAEEISKYFNEPLLKPMVRVLSLGIIINAFTLIQSIQLTKRIDFKLQTKVSIIAVVVSGCVGIGMAYTGYGVWSLIVKIILGYLLTFILLWYWNKWKTSLMFSVASFKELFSFGSKLLVSGLIDTIYTNIYYLIIGKYYTAVELGYYTRAEQFQSLPSSNIQGVIGRVSYPILTTIQDDIPRLREVYKKIIRSTMFITFVLMLGMAAVARPMVLTLIGEKWEPCVVYLQMLCFVGMLYPLHVLNLNMLNVQGRSDLFLRLEIIKKTLAVPVIVIAVICGIKAMILGMIFLSLIAYYLNSYWSGRLIGYSTLEQIKDILPSFMLAVIMSSIVFVEGLLLPLSPFPLLIIQLITGAVLAFGLCEGFHFKDYLYIKSIVNEKFLKGDHA
jgi:O-antigen/teichoic acid export membrane protein